MSDWQTKLLAILHADTDDLGELAKIAGADPRTFYRGANFRNADLSQQDILQFDLSDCRIDEAEIADSARQILNLKQKVLKVRSDSAECARLMVELAFALTTEGKRTDDVALFAESITFGTSAMDYYSSVDFPYSRSVIMGNNSNNLEELGLRAPKKQRAALLDKAIQEQRDAIAFIGTEDYLLIWAKMHLVLAQKLLKTANATYVKFSTLASDAVIACEQAMTVFTRTGNPYEWAQTQHVLAQALLGLGKRRKSSSGRQQLIEATVACNNALSTLDRATSPLEWADLMDTKAAVAQALAQRTLGDEAETHWKTASDSINSALRIFAKERLLQRHIQAVKLRDKILARE